MSDRFYVDNYDNYIRPPCAQQSQNNVHQYTSFSPSQTYNMQYESNYFTHITRSQTYSTFSNCTGDQLDSANWIPDPRAVADIERGLSLSDKIETIEITSKDLSPVSCCSNIDSLIPNFNQATQWFSNTNPSCSFDYSSTFYPEVDYDLFNHEPLYSQSFLDVSNLGDGSNDDSDIIVEESDDNVTDCGEDNEPNVTSAHCIVCNALYMPVGSQFYVLNVETPLTMSSQQPVVNKLIQLVGQLDYKGNYVCSHCLNLINTIDNLQMKLEASKLELCGNYERTCREHNIKTNSLDSPRRRKKFKHFCGLHSFKCKFCKKLFSFKKLYESHLSRHQPRFLCEVCGRRFSENVRLKLHMRLHHKRLEPKTIAAFDCKSCGKLFRTKTNLKEHENYCSGILPFACTHDACDKRFASATRLKNHIQLKHDLKFAAICSICNIGFVKLSDYKSHKTTHSEEKKHPCPKCDKSYKTISNLNHHMKFHDDRLPFVCTICGKGFMRKEYLEAHVNNHNGIKNFACQLCSKKFVSQKNLDAHLKYHEGGIKKKTCNVCGKAIASGFEEHLRTHSNLKEFECSLCLAKFNTKGTLAKHRKRKHPNEGSSSNTLPVH